MRHFARVLATAVAVWLAAASSAQADMTKDQCIDANAKGQDLRHDGKLILARAAFVSCTNVKCPAIVRDDCTRRGGGAHHDTAVTDGMISTVSFIAGGALLAGGAVLFFSARRTEASPSKSISIVPTAGYRQAGLALTGAL